MIKKSFLKNKKLRGLSTDASLVYMSLFCIVDTEGRMLYTPFEIQSASPIFLTFSDDRVNSIIKELIDANAVILYEFDGQTILQVVDYYDWANDPDKRKRVNKKIKELCERCNILNVPQMQSNVPQMQSNAPQMQSNVPEIRWNSNLASKSDESDEYIETKSHDGLVGNSKNSDKKPRNEEECRINQNDKLKEEKTEKEEEEKEEISPTKRKEAKEKEEVYIYNPLLEEREEEEKEKKEEKNKKKKCINIHFEKSFVPQVSQTSMFEDEIVDANVLEEEDHRDDETIGTEFDVFWNFWNKEMPEGVPKVRTPIKGKRRLSLISKLKTRIKEDKDFPGKFKKAIEYAQGIPFYLGQGRDGWIITFDHLIANGRNCEKIIEKGEAQERINRSKNIDLEKMRRLDEIANARIDDYLNGRITATGEPIGGNDENT